MEKSNKCECCKMMFLDNVELSIHFESSAHKQQEKCHRSIFISQVPNEINVLDVVKLVSAYGVVQKYNVAKKNANYNLTIEFKNKETVQRVLSEANKIDNKDLHVFPLKYFNKTDNDHLNSIISYSKVKELLNNHLNFDDQLQAFIKFVSCTDQEIETRYESACNALDQLLQNIFSKSKCYMFGSMITGLGFKNSDLDIYLNIGMPVLEDDVLVNGPHVITLNRIFLLVEKIIRRERLFTNCYLIRRARMPIIKCLYLPTKVSCDISFKNSIALYNSKLIHYYLSIDIRLKRIMMILKYWLHNYELTIGIGITKYAMTLLFIFYLQQIKLVPPVFKLQEKCKVPLLIKGWQVNFNQDSTEFNVKDNYRIKSIPEILGDFFEFYASYDFKNYVLCPMDGQSHNKELIEQRKCLTPGLMRYMNYLKENENPELLATWKPLCLQDPIELNINITKHVSISNLEKLKNYFSVAARIVETSKNNYGDLLKKLFNLENNSESIYKVKLNYIPLDIYISKLLQSTKRLNAKRDMFSNKVWFNIIFYVIQQVFENVLKLEVQISKPAKNSVKQEVENEKSPHAEDKNVIILHCKGNQRLWFNRKDIKLHYNVQNPLEKEIIISDQLLKTTERNVIIDVECHIFRKTILNDHIGIMLYDNGCLDKTFNEFANYFIAKTPSILKNFFSHIAQNEHFFKSLTNVQFD